MERQMIPYMHDKYKLIIKLISSIKVAVQFCNIYFLDITPNLLTLRTFLRSNYDMQWCTARGGGGRAKFGGSHELLPAALKGSWVYH